VTSVRLSTTHWRHHPEKRSFHCTSMVSRMHVLLLEERISA
jgi:hypothetical protein